MLNAERGHHHGTTRADLRLDAEGGNHVPTCFRKNALVVDEDGARAGARVAEDVDR